MLHYFRFKHTAPHQDIPKILSTNQQVKKNDVTVLHIDDPIPKKQEDKIKKLKQAYKPVLPEDMQKHYYKKSNIMPPLKHLHT